MLKLFLVKNNLKFEFLTLNLPRKDVPYVYLFISKFWLKIRSKKCPKKENQKNFWTIFCFTNLQNYLLIYFNNFQGGLIRNFFEKNVKNYNF